MKISNMTAQSIVHGLIRIVGIVALVSLPFLPSLGLAQEDAPAKPKTPRMTCGKCDEGYVTTGRTTDANICKEGDPTLVECVPIGSMNLLAVCGSCPEGYVEVGSSTVPARCGNADGGRMSQCQLQKPESGLPDPKQGGLFCPPNCAGQMPTPGQGTLPRAPKMPPPPEEQK